MRNFVPIFYQSRHLFFMLKLRFVLFTLISCAVLPVLANYQQASHSIDSLDYYIDNHNKYREIKCSQIRAKSNKIKLAENDCQRLPIYAEIIDDYLHVDVDSALHYTDLALRLCEQCGDSAQMALLKMQRSIALTARGELYLATVVFESINPKNIATKDRATYFEAGYNVYSRAFIYLQSDPGAKVFERKTKNAIDSLNSFSVGDDIKNKYYIYIDKIHGSNDIDAIADLIDLLSKCHSGSYLYGQIALEIARHYAKENEYGLAKYYYISSAISDIKGGFNETDALYGLGKALHDEGNIDLANKYYNCALDHAILNNDDAAALRIAKGLKSIIIELKSRINKANKMRTFALIALALTLIIAGALILFSKHKREHLYKNSRILSQKHNSKDSYIRQMLSLYAQQITALDDYNRLVGRKIKASQATDMLRIAESGTVVNEQIEKFHNLFDNAFLSLHPDFINKVNELMLEDRKFTTPSSGLLNTELRYLAFMNLGVDDYQQIAIFLGITQNSVYTYKNKLKSRAENRDKFEENIVNLY